MPTGCIRLTTTRWCTLIKILIQIVNYNKLLWFPVSLTQWLLLVGFIIIAIYPEFWYIIFVAQITWRHHHELTLEFRGDFHPFMDTLSCRSRCQNWLRCEIIVISITLHFLPSTAARLRPTLQKFRHSKQWCRFFALIILIFHFHCFDQKSEGFPIELVDTENGHLAWI